MEVKKRNTLLVIDDDIDFINLLRHRVEKYNLDVVTHENADLLMEMFSNQEIIVILLDLNFYDEMRGLQFIDILRKKYTQDVPIVIVSAVRTTSVIAKALELGATEYLHKPLLRHQFDELIEKYLDPKKEFDSDLIMSKIRKEVQKAELTLQLNITEVSNYGFNLLSGFLISKGTKLTLRSPLILEIFNEESIRVYVNKNELVDESKNLYLIETEVDSFDTDKIDKLRIWLLKMKSRNLK